MTATVIERLNQHKAEARVEEIVAVAGIETEYEAVDTEGDLAVEAQLGRLFQVLDSEAERAEAARLFVIWQSSERIEDSTVHEVVGGTVEFIKSNNDLFLSDGCGPKGRAA